MVQLPNNYRCQDNSIDGRQLESWDNSTVCHPNSSKLDVYLHGSNKTSQWLGVKTKDTIYSTSCLIDDTQTDHSMSISDKKFLIEIDSFISCICPVVPLCYLHDVVPLTARTWRLIGYGIPFALRAWSVFKLSVSSWSAFRSSL